MTRVLVVEDSPTQAARVRLILESEGFTVEAAADGDEGFERCLVSPVDLVLTDILMPHVSGYELCRRIKGTASTKNIPVILLTTLKDPMDVIEGLACGAENFITKPYEPDYVIARIRNVLANSRLRAERKVAAGVEIVFMGRRFTIDSEKEQILGLLVSTFEDVVRANRDLRASQSALQEAERETQARSAELARANKELEAFVYTVSHDLKAPLRGIEGFSRILLEDYACALDPEGRHYLDLLRDSSDRMHQLIDDLLAFSRVGRDRTPADRIALGTLVREVLDGLRFALQEAEAAVEIPPDLPSYLGYPVLLRQLFGNLLGNALKYRRTEVPLRIAIGWRRLDDSGLEMTVSDNGIGVAAQYRERVFGLFQRLHRQEQYPGTGLGLAICKRIVEEHGGVIGIEETSGGGCTVRFSIRSVRAAKLPAAEADADSAPGA